jgi:hypothetical protein
MDIRMMKMFRRVNTPTTPIVKSAALRMIYQDRGTIKPP